MSKNRLDMVDTFDQFGHDHWKALGTLLGGVEVTKSVLRGTSKVTVESLQPFADPSRITLSAIQEPTRLTDYKNVWLNAKAVNLFATVKSLPAMPEGTFKWILVDKSLDDVKIVWALGGPRSAIVKSVEELEVAIGQFIDEPSNHLNSDGKANLFYVLNPERTERELLCVKVFQAGSQWRVYCCVAGEREWGGGALAFRQLSFRT